MHGGGIVGGGIGGMGSQSLTEVGAFPPIDLLSLPGCLAAWLSGCLAAWLPRRLDLRCSPRLCMAVAFRTIQSQVPCPCASYPTLAAVAGLAAARGGAAHAGGPLP